MEESFEEVIWQIKQCLANKIPKLFLIRSIHYLQFQDNLDRKVQQLKEQINKLQKSVEE
jgi:hypothetical protein